MEPGRRAVASAGSASLGGGHPVTQEPPAFPLPLILGEVGFRPTQLWFIQSLGILLLSSNVNVLFILHMKKTAFMPIGA